MVIILLVSFLATLLGAVGGIGGGVIIKPVLDATGKMLAEQASFLSSCTVFAMSVMNLFKTYRDKKKGANVASLGGKTTIFLAIGAATGGLLGKQIVSFIKSALHADAGVGLVQTIVLTVIMIGILVYTIFKKKIKTRKLTNAPVCFLVGLVLGILASFLGVGGGPFNLIALHYFFSMEAKTAAFNSVFVIFLSQFTNISKQLITMTAPSVDYSYLVAMIICGILGGFVGSSVNKKIRSEDVEKLFLGAVVVIILIGLYNCYRFYGLQFGG